MLNSNEKEILNVIQDKEYMNCINANPNDIETAINLGIKEVTELEKIVQIAFENKESFMDLSKRLGGHNESFSEKYPDSNYFDLNYKSLLITVKEKLDKNNNSMGFSVMKSDVYIYPDNISSIAADEICILNLDQNINFEKIKNELENEEKVEEINEEECEIQK